MATTAGALNSLYPALIIALSNSAPYFKHLSVTTSTRLIQLIKSFSNPLFLLSDEGHPRLLFFMYVNEPRRHVLDVYSLFYFRLEAFNSVILHNLPDNPNLIYGILTAHKTFEDLGTFTLSRGLREIRRIQLAKEEQTRQAEGRVKGESAADNEEEPSAEKARSLGSEQLGETELETLEEGTREPDVPDGARGPEDETSAHILSSLTSEIPSPAGSAPSEKARGKMKARRSVSVEMTGSLERIAAQGVGKNGFVPTQEWVTSWQQGQDSFYPTRLCQSLIFFSKASSRPGYAYHIGVISQSTGITSCAPQVKSNSCNH